MGSVTFNSASAMSSKKFKGKTCAYCGVPGCSDTADHVFAKEFFLRERRANLPKVPACRPCNEDKAKLEHYLTQVLPFGGRHPDASVNLGSMLPKRLAKNPALGGALRSSMSPIWIPDPSGLILRTSTITIDASKLEQWCGLLVRGLSYYHWKTVIGSECFFEFMVPTKDGEAILDNLLSKRGAARIKVSLGGGTFAYEALQGIDNPQVSAWWFSIYGGLMLGGGDPTVRSGTIGVLTGPRRVKERAGLAVKWLHGRAGRP